MDAIIMPSTPSLLPKLQADFPLLTFIAGDDFLWSPQEKTVYYVATDPEYEALLLHELSHSLLDHQDYQRDIQLVAMETEAWEKARTLSKQYDVTITEDALQDHLDTYRDWLHARSTCPRCEATGMQSNKQQYRCLACHHEWRVNEARVCALRRYSIKK